VANELTENIGILLGYGNENFDTQMTYPTGIGSRPYLVAIGDYNNDKQTDIVIIACGPNHMGIISNFCYSFTF
jgi:hypothetical protein